MEVTLEKFIGLTCEIKSLMNDHLGTGIIGDFSDDGNEMDIISHNNEFLPTLPYNQAVKIICHAPKIGFRLFLGRVYLSSRELMRVMGVGTQQSIERRQYFRLNVACEAELTMQSPLPKDASQDDEIQAIKVEVRDVSLGGLRIASQRIFHPNERFILTFALLSQRTEMSCVVCREVFFENQRRGEHQYGCRFVDVTEKQLDKLCADLFELQRIEIRKRKDKQNL